MSQPQQPPIELADLGSIHSENSSTTRAALSGSDNHVPPYLNVFSDTLRALKHASYSGSSPFGRDGQSLETWEVRLGEKHSSHQARPISPIQSSVNEETAFDKSLHKDFFLSQEPTTIVRISMIEYAKSLSQLDILHLTSHFRLPMSFWSGSRDATSPRSFGSRNTAETVKGLRVFDTWVALSARIDPSDTLKRRAYPQLTFAQIFIRWTRRKENSDRAVVHMLFYHNNLYWVNIPQALIQLIHHPQCIHVPHDPYLLYGIIFGTWIELLHSSFMGIQANVMRAQPQGYKARGTNLMILHQMAYDVIEFTGGPLKSSCRILEALIEDHEKNRSELTLGSDEWAGSFDVARSALDELRIRQEMLTFQAEQMKEHMQNYIQLAFNRFTQRDSQMTTAVTIITLFFLPGTAVAAIFSTVFFVGDGASESPLKTRDFHVYWAITIPATLFFLALWRLWILHENKNMWDAVSFYRKEGRMIKEFHKQKHPGQ